jgi:hypothetical protein
VHGDEDFPVAAFIAASLSLVRGARRRPFLASRIPRGEEDAACSQARPRLDPADPLTVRP